jgi:hypothetical protein
MDRSVGYARATTSEGAVNQVERVLSGLERRVRRATDNINEQVMTIAADADRLYNDQMAIEGKAISGPSPVAPPQGTVPSLAAALDDLERAVEGLRNHAGRFGTL